MNDDLPYVLKQPPSRTELLLNEAEIIIADLLTKSASVFILNEIIWITADRMKLRLNNEQQAERYLETVKQLAATVKDREFR